MKVGELIALLGRIPSDKPLPPGMAYEASLAAYALGEFSLTERILRELDAAAPGRLKHLYDLASAILAQGRFAEARGILETLHAERRDDPLVALGLAVARLGRGDYAGGWPLYEARAQFPDHHLHPWPCPPWRGEPLAGKTILVCPEQGFGDQIMCARFAPILRDQGARVLMLVRAPLVRLFLGLGVEVVALEDGAPGLPAQPDFHTHPFSMPRWLGTILEDLPSQPYLAGTPRRSGRVGVVWRGRPTHHRDRLRSLPADLGERLLALPGAVDLDPAVSAARDFQDTADLIAGLDRVITVDTSVAHLAGAMGKPVTILLSAWGLDWRWMADRPDTPWYPAATLLRQRTPGDWQEVLARL